MTIKGTSTDAKVVAAHTMTYGAYGPSGTLLLEKGKTTKASQDVKLTISKAATATTTTTTTGEVVVKKPVGQGPAAKNTVSTINNVV